MATKAQGSTSTTSEGHQPPARAHRQGPLLMSIRMLLACLLPLLAVCAALFTQHRLEAVDSLWFRLQQVIFLVIAAAGLFALLFPGPALRRAAAALALLAALTGMVAALKHHTVAEASAPCALPLVDRIMAVTGLDRRFDALLATDAACAAVKTDLLGVPDPFWSLGLFMLLAAIAAGLLVRPSDQADDPSITSDRHLTHARNDPGWPASWCLANQSGAQPCDGQIRQRAWLWFWPLLLALLLVPWLGEPDNKAEPKPKEATQSAKPTDRATKGGPGAAAPEPVATSALPFAVSDWAKPWVSGTWWLMLAIALVVNVRFLARTLLWRHYRARGAAHLLEEDEFTATPLPSQQPFVDKMLARLRQFTLTQPGPTWPIEGRWGDGKSFLVAEIQRELCKPVNGQQRACALYVHVWREQTEGNLHLAIVEAILSHPWVLQNAYPAYPAARLIARKVGHTLLGLIPAGMSVAWGGVNGTITPQAALPLMAQQDLEQVVGHLRRQGLRLVLVLDEIDRATPEVAQAAIVLTKRAFNLPGLAVVLPFVRTQLHFKAFSPLFAQSRDLFYTLVANMHAGHPVDLFGPDGFAADTEAPAAADKDDKKVKPRDSLAEGHQQAHARRMLDFEKRQLLLFSGLDPGQQQFLTEQAVEKFLSHTVSVPMLEARDIAACLKFQSVDVDVPDAVQPADLDFAMQHALDGTSGLFGQPIARLQPPAVRHFESQLIAFVATAPELQDADPDRSDDDWVLRLAVVVANAWRSAQTLSRP